MKLHDYGLWTQIKLIIRNRVRDTVYLSGHLNKETIQNMYSNRIRLVATYMWNSARADEAKDIVCYGKKNESN